MDDSEVLAALAGGESLTVEFKRHRSKSDLPESELAEAVVCLANGRGGTLLLGVEDDGTVSGFGPLPTNPQAIAALIMNRTQPNVPVEASAHDIERHIVVAITVPDMPRVVGTKSGVYKRRALGVDGRPQCLPYLPEEMLSDGLFAAGQDYAALPARGAEMNDLDPRELDRLRAMCGRDSGDEVLAALSDEEICRALRVLDTSVEPPRPTIGAVLLFGKEEALARYVPSVEAIFQARDDAERLRRSDVLRAPLLRTLDWMAERIEPFNEEQEVMVGLLRVAVPRVAPDVVREAVANALVHRDYTEMGPVRVLMSPESMTVTSPGGFPRGVNLDNLLDTSAPRSPILADAFKRAGLVDRAGRGISRMFRAQLLAGRDEPDYAASTDAAVRVEVPTADADLDMVRFVRSYADGLARDLPLDQVRVLHELRHSGRVRMSELQMALRLSATKVRTASTRLVEQGLVEQIGSGRARQYSLGPAYYEAASDRDAYVRVRSTDPVQQRQMILQYVEAYGSMTRGQVMSLCSVGTSQARSLLRDLVGAGQLVLRGERRGAHYVLPSRDGSEDEKPSAPTPQPPGR
ncbi:putative DNA binding domain-containing protein [Luteipulveratus sp. YIM 133132]|uniref:RNA-binding domain-containing protein n=1 Tax=Luteipulveratus flavus TaxID=3031728 RepID=UPI0023B02683|nr:RNA-binding domain-containing protein [Luteipulveratus sp. YIM 133132]MDE9366897.1 putative DNA binding domain-containing protein [Luteipulveratus sp. YIM 133132]